MDYNFRKNVANFNIIPDVKLFEHYEYLWLKPDADFNGITSKISHSVDETRQVGDKMHG